MDDLGAFSTSERMFLVEAAYGRAMLKAHSLERTLRTLLVCDVAFGAKREGAPTSRVEKIDRMPLGPLIEEFAKTFLPPESLIDELDNLLFFRNELAHRISDSILRAAAQETWEKKLVTELAEIESYFEDVWPVLRAYVDAFRPKTGLTEQQLLELGRELYPGIASRV